MKITLTRDYLVDCTLGSAVITNKDISVFTFKTMELPWLDNQRRVSCIPKGTYKAVRHNSPKFGETFWIQDVPGRSEILIHKGNYTKDTLGCILPGKAHIDINGDGTMDVTSSKKTMEKILKTMPNIFTIEIV